MAEATDQSEPSDAELAALQQVAQGEAADVLGGIELATPQPSEEVRRFCIPMLAMNNTCLLLR